MKKCSRVSGSKYMPIKLIIQAHSHSYQGTSIIDFTLTKVNPNQKFTAENENVELISADELQLTLTDY
jgi:hypothetical protein